jgi:hypothetical protein
MMSAHKFDIGQIVRSEASPNSGIPPGSYEIVRQLPSGDAARDLQYRVKATLDGHERIVKESDLK